ncbi:hypothetical protein Fot_11184 [Forsythia ovata]|uniref:Uncharacterized protein n=1 Tax=Forsythia ovata TaxID=205694 RepID=A0ABD1WIZ9_9LAMI
MSQCLESCGFQTFVDILVRKSSQTHIYDERHPEKREEEYVRFFVSGPIREDPILDAYLHEDGVDDAAGNEEPYDIFEQVGQSSPAVAPRAPLRRSHPCCEHENTLRQILEQIKNLTDQVDEMKRNVDMLEEQKQRSPHFYGEYMDDDSGMNWDGVDVSIGDQRQRGAEETNDREVDMGIDGTGQGSVEEPVETMVEDEADSVVDIRVGIDRVEGEAEALVDIEVGTTMEDDQEEAVDTSVDTTVEGEVAVTLDTEVGTMVEGDTEEADQPHRRTT